MRKLILLLAMGLTLTASAMDAVDFLRVSIQKSNEFSTTQKEALLSRLALTGRYSAAAGAVCEETLITVMASVRVQDNPKQTHLEQQMIVARDHSYWLRIWGRHLASELFPRDFPANLKDVILELKSPLPTCTLQPPVIRKQGVSLEGDMLRLTRIPVRQIRCNQKEFLSSYRKAIPLILNEIILEAIDNEKWTAAQTALKGMSVLGENNLLSAPAAYLVCLHTDPSSAELPDLLKQTVGCYSNLPEKWKNLLLDSALEKERSADVTLFLKAAGCMLQERGDDK